ncbi:hypothetical protein OG714_24805 [Streptomyces sp. NBC_00989]|nr:hypothetical protein OG714_24805 [Streptomyces sp. NBC_00989]
MEIAYSEGKLLLRESDDPTRPLSTTLEGLHSLLGHIRATHA